MRFAAYDWAKTVVHTGELLLPFYCITQDKVGTDDLDTTTPIPGYKMALAGSMAGGIAGFLGNPAELIMVRMQADKAKPEGRESSTLLSSLIVSIQMKCERAKEANVRTVQLQKLYSRSSSND